MAEGAGAAGLAAVLADPPRFKDRRVGLVITGGNIDPRLLASIIMRGLVRSGRLCRLSVGVTDVPGALGRVAAIVGELRGNIVEVAHQRLFSDLSVKRARRPDRRGPRGGGLPGAAERSELMSVAGDPDLPPDDLVTLLDRAVDVIAVVCRLVGAVGAVVSPPPPPAHGPPWTVHALGAT